MNIATLTKLVAHVDFSTRDVRFKHFCRALAETLYKHFGVLERDLRYRDQYFFSWEHVQNIIRIGPTIVAVRRTFFVDVRKLEEDFTRIGIEREEFEKHKEEVFRAVGRAGGQIL